jgi:hypothetical protein
MLRIEPDCVSNRQSSASNVYSIMSVYLRSHLPTCRLDINTKLTSLVRLKPTDTLKLTWTVLEGETPVQPHQTFLRFYDEQSGEEGIQPVKVTSDGKAQFTLVRLTFLLVLSLWLVNG